jgi:hypothetical protein
LPREVAVDVQEHLRQLVPSVGQRGGVDQVPAAQREAERRAAHGLHDERGATVVQAHVAEPSRGVGAAQQVGGLLDAEGARRRTGRHSCRGGCRSGGGIASGRPVARVGRLAAGDGNGEQRREEDGERQGSRRAGRRRCRPAQSLCSAIQRLVNLAATS